MALPALFILLSLAILYFGAGILVKGAASLALKLGITPLIIGLTVVAYGTSMPELLVSVSAALKGNSDIAIGNVVGSNIFNIGMVLGISALFSVLKVKLQVLRLDAPVMVLITLVFLFFFLDHKVSRPEGFILLAILATYTVFNLILARRESKSDDLAEYESTVKKTSTHWALDILFLLGGFALLTVGSGLLVDNAVKLAHLMGLSNAVIGLTIISAGTGMPELATSVVAAIKKEHDITIGNIIGSNIFNILGIVGVTSVIHPISSPQIALTDMFVMAGISLLLLLLLITGKQLRRWEGLLLLLIYVAYIYYLIPE